MTARSYYSMLKEQPEVLTVAEVSKILRLGKNKTYDLVNTGRLSSIKVGGKIIVPKTCLITFLLDTKNYQFESQIVSDSLWKKEENSDIIETDDRAAKAFCIA